MLHEFSRAELLLGAEAIEKLAASHVAVFGVGGVGSFACEALARAGERLAGERTDPAYAEHGNMRCGELFYGFCAEQQLCAGEFMQHGITSQKR